MPQIEDLGIRPMPRFKAGWVVVDQDLLVTEDFFGAGDRDADQ